MNKPKSAPPRQTEYHVLLALADGHRYGYEICARTATESEGAVRLQAGSLYRLLARLMEAGLVREVEVNEASEPHPGLPRRYYDLTESGQRLLREETSRLRRVVALARRRVLAGDGAG